LIFETGQDKQELDRERERKKGENRNPQKKDIKKERS
jgi:hypothetical protein